MWWRIWGVAGFGGAASGFGGTGGRVVPLGGIDSPNWVLPKAGK
jgi:hypothetical protein